jgi:hypothetical protein
MKKSEKQLLITIRAQCEVLLNCMLMTCSGMPSFQDQEVIKALRSFIHESSDFDKED